MMTPEISRLHEEYENAPQVIKDGVDGAYASAISYFKEMGFDTANDDRAEILVVALYQYLVDSAEQPKPYQAPRLNPDIPRDVADSLLGVYDPADNGNQGS